MSENGKKKNLPKKVLDHLVDQAGGEEAVWAQYGQDRIVEMGAEGCSVQDLLDTGEKEGWGQSFRELSLGELVELFAPPKTSGGNGTRGPRISPEIVQGAVLEVLQGAEGPLSAAQIMDANDQTREYGTRCKNALGAMVKDGKVTRTGSKASSVYTLTP